MATEQLTQGTIDTERSSWSMQEAEARAWVLNNASPTPALSVLATARGVPMSLLVEKVIQKADLYKTYYFYFLINTINTNHLSTKCCVNKKVLFYF